MESKQLKDQATMATYPRIDFHNISGYRTGVGIISQRCGWFLLKSIETLELANTIRLIHKGGTLIDQGMSHKIFESLMSKRDTTIKSNRL